MIQFVILTNILVFVNIMSRSAGGGGIGRHASLRCLWRKSWPFKSAPPHKGFQIGSSFFLPGFSGG